MTKKKKYRESVGTWSQPILYTHTKTLYAGRNMSAVRRHNKKLMSQSNRRTKTSGRTTLLRRRKPEFQDL